MTWPITPRAVTAAAEAIEDEAVRRLGFNLGTIHRDDIAQAGLLAGLNAMGAVEFGFNLEDHLRRQREFSERTFGPGARAKGVVAHIRKELDEIEADPTDLTEWIDVMILALDGAWRSGASPEQIIRALINKQRRNEQRTWPDWRTASEDQPIEHDRSVPERLPTAQCRPTMHDLEGACYWCCERCNVDRHQCPGCGDPLRHNGTEKRTGVPHTGCTS